MTKSTKQNQTAVRRQGRRVVPALRRNAAAAKDMAGAAASKVQLTLGDLIAAALDTVGGEADKAAQVLGSREMKRAIGRKIVFI